jgi:hypothetical protein
VPKARQLTAGGRTAVKDHVPVPGSGGGRLRRRLRAVPGAVPRGGLVGYAVLVLGGGAGTVVHAAGGVQPARVRVAVLLPAGHQAVDGEGGGGVHGLERGRHVADDVLLVHDHRLGVAVLGAHALAELRVGFPLRLALQLALAVLQRLLLALVGVRLVQLLALQGLLLLPEGVLLLEAPPTPQVRPVVEHVVRVRVQRPVAPLARLLVVTWHLDEALVQTEVVPDGVLPPLLVLAVVREPLHDELVDAVQGDFLVGGVLDGHCDERDVRVWRLHHVFGGAELVLLVVPGGVPVPGVLLVGVGVCRGGDGGGRRGRAVAAPGPVVGILMFGEDGVHDVRDGSQGASATGTTCLYKQSRVKITNKTKPDESGSEIVRNFLK